jgi:hypothetical protein
MLRALGLATALLLLLDGSAAAQPKDRDRPIRVGNSNLLVFGYGVGSFSHPTYSSEGFINIGYQRRILRRELRVFPIWVRGAVNYTSDERTSDSTYTYWTGDAGISPFTEVVTEQTSDFSVRVELLADLLHGKNYALYAGGGFVVHLISFSSRGDVSGRQGGAGLEVNDNRLAPSLAGGFRVFMASRAYSLYSEVRYGLVYGRAQGTQDLPDRKPPSTAEFDLESVNSLSIEGGLGFHW